MLCVSFLYQTIKYHNFCLNWFHAKSQLCSSPFYKPISAEGQNGALSSHPLFSAKIVVFQNRILPDLSKSYYYRRFSPTKIYGVLSPPPPFFLAEIAWRSKWLSKSPSLPFLAKESVQGGRGGLSMKSTVGRNVEIFDKKSMKNSY